MTQDTGPRRRGTSAAASRGPLRRYALTPAVEPLEGRTLLSGFYSGPSAVRPVQSAGGIYTLTMSGPGLEKVTPAGHGQIAVTLFGTTPASTLNIALTRPRLHAAAAGLQIASIRVISGQLGGIVAPGADLNGVVTPLTGQVNTLEFADLGPKAQIDVKGGVGTLSISGAAALGPSGHVNIGGNVSQALSIGALNLTGGRFVVANDITAPLNLGSLGLSQGGQFLVGHDVTGAAKIAGNASITGKSLFSIGHDLAGGLTVGGDLTLDSGGRFVVVNDITAPLNLGSLGLSQGGQFLVGHDVTGAAKIAGNASITGKSLFSIGHDLAGGLTVGGDLTLDSGGQLAVRNDLTGALNVGGVLSISNSSRLIVNLDATGAITVSGDLSLASGGTFVVNRTLSALTVNGNLTVAPTGGGIIVGGDLTNLTVNGSFSGQNTSPSATTKADLTVGLNLGALNVLGGGSDQGGVQNVNIDVKKSILSLNIQHGIFNSFITAGVNINGGSSGNNIGADGTDAIHNSEIRAGVTIDNLTINGDVRSTFVTDQIASPGFKTPGDRTRIIAGEDRAGHYSNGGLIDHFQITGQLIDSVIAASVAPYGDSGKLPTSDYGAPPPSVPAGSGDLGFNTYDAPAGTITGGTFGAPIVYKNYSELSYVNETLVGVTYNTAIDPTIDDTILFGAINPSFATAPAMATDTTVTTNSGSANSGTTTTTSGTSSTTTIAASSQAQSLPSKSTVLGGVISNPHGDEADFAGIFAADTRGVFVGPLP